MSFNVDKCMVFQLHKKEFLYKQNISCTIQNLKMTESASYLGVEIDSKLSLNHNNKQHLQESLLSVGLLAKEL